MEITIRRRLGRSTSVKGVVTPDATIEVIGKTEGEIVLGPGKEENAESAFFWKLHDEFMAEVDKRYPPVSGKEEK